MKWCNTCEKEIEDALDVCPTCGESLSDVLKTDHDFDDMVSGDYEALTHIRDNVEANVFISYLNSNGIETYVHYENEGPYKALLTEPGTEGTLVLVSSNQIEEAKELMEAFKYEHES